MMANTILSSGVRNNLLTLQKTTAEQSIIQNRLATGKVVNSAIDNPVNFFTSLALYDRSSQLNGLLDGMSNGIQTIQSASKGIDGITSLVKSLQSTIKQAQSDAAQNRPTKAGTTLASAGEKIAANKSLKDIALDKSVLDQGVDGVDGNDGDPDPATAISSGDLGIAVANTTFAISITVGDPTADPPEDFAQYQHAFGGSNATVRDVVNEINKSGIATAFVDEKGQLNVKGTGSQPVQFGFAATAAPANPNDPVEVAAAEAAAITAAETGTDNEAIGFDAADADITNTTIISPNVTLASRSNLIDQFNTLRKQIDELAKDSSFNGINLLAGDALTIVFNEKTGINQTKLNIQGNTISADNLGILQATNTQLDGQINLQNDLDLEKASESLTGALTSLKSLASTLGSNLSVAQTRQDFTKELGNVLTNGADNLVLADPNAEGASLLALNTRQQLSQTALSLANQADQGVLRLFG